jgi:hypothetical protein
MLNGWNVLRRHRKPPPNYDRRRPCESRKGLSTTAYVRLGVIGSAESLAAIKRIEDHAARLFLCRRVPRPAILFIRLALFGFGTQSACTSHRHKRCNLCADRQFIDGRSRSVFDDDAHAGRRVIMVAAIARAEQALSRNQGRETGDEFC